MDIRAGADYYTAGLLKRKSPAKKVASNLQGNYEIIIGTI